MQRFQTLVVNYIDQKYLNILKVKCIAENKWQAIIGIILNKIEFSTLIFIVYSKITFKS